MKNVIRNLVVLSSAIVIALPLLAGEGKKGKRLKARAIKSLK